MYRFPLIYVSKLTHITLKRDPHKVISISCYPEALVEASLCLQVFDFIVSVGKTCMYLKGILGMRAVTLSAPNRMTRGKGFLSVNKFEQKSPTPLLFGVSQSTHGPFQVMKFPTSMELRIFESGFQMVLYFKGWRSPPVAPRDLCSLIYEPGAKQ